MCAVGKVCWDMRAGSLSARLSNLLQFLLLETGVCGQGTIKGLMISDKSVADVRRGKGMDEWTARLAAQPST